MVREQVHVVCVDDGAEVAQVWLHRTYAKRTFFALPGKILS